MKDTFDAKQDIISLINFPEVTEVFQARIWLSYIPSGIKGTNIVVSSLFLNNKFLQSGIILVRSHIPNISGQSFPDLAKFAQLESILIPLLDAQYKYSFWTEVEEVLPVTRDDDGSFYSTIRVHYYSINLNYSL
jgi:hypothetical protein